MKEAEIRKRRAQREKASLEWKEALKNRDYVKAFSKAVMTSRLTQNMIEDAKELLTLLGIPYVQALTEAEAQTAYMSMRGDVWAASSKDYDSLLFGASRLLRFLTIYGQEYLPSKRKARPLKPELITLRQLLHHHGITRRQLVDLAILVGTDFNEGIKGVGPKTALRVVKKYGEIESLPSEFLSKLTPQYQQVREIYLHPEIVPQYALNYDLVREEELFHFLCDKRDFARERVETAVHRMKETYSRKKQMKLEKWFAAHT